MLTRVKICGITRLEDARLAVELGASALGFNFYKPSPRYISPSTARATISDLSPFVTAVGIFADEADGIEVARTAETAGVSVVQIHGPQFPSGIEDGRLGRYPVIRAVAVTPGFDVASLAALKAAAWLLDAYDPVRVGGSGNTIDWNVARAAKRYGSVILAGGLTPENVARAIAEVRPYAVDVASGVESSPGIKSEKELRTFFQAVESAARIPSEDGIDDSHGSSLGSAARGRIRKGVRDLLSKEG